VTYPNLAGSEDALGSLALSCGSGGASGSFFAPLPSDYQNQTDADALAGTTAEFSLAITDSTGITGEDTGSLSFQ
jgi:hypothetical protein